MTTSGLLRHLVLFTFHPSSNDKAINEVVRSFMDLKGLVPSLIDMEWGPNISPENHHQGFTHCFLLSFESLAGLEAYQHHPAHRAFQEVLRPHMDRVFVVDWGGR
ncbi:MAG: Dabb family protein [Bacteroidia bacterium]|nr:Dabb family protein [Bacteroidia bacterium]